jgi:hypothetical protein
MKSNILKIILLMCGMVIGDNSHLFINLQYSIDELYEKAECIKHTRHEQMLFTKWNIIFNQTKHHHQSQECPENYPWRYPGGESNNMICCKYSPANVIARSNFGKWLKIKGAEYLDMWGIPNYTGNQI